MLAVVFEAGEEMYALPVKLVREVLPSLKARRLPGAPDYVKGVFSYRGTIVPILDLCMLLCGRPCAESLGTRLLIVDMQSSGGTRPLAVVAERVIRTVELDAASLCSVGVEEFESPFLGEIAAGMDRMIQLVRPSELLPAEWRDKVLGGELEDVR